MVAIRMADREMVAIWRRTEMILDEVKEHYRNLWGQSSRRASFRLSGHLVEVWKWNAESNPQQVNMYATLGCSAHVVAGYDNDHRVEFFVGLQPSEDDVARSLSMLAFEAMGNKVELGHGHSMTFPEPLWRGTRMNAFLVIRPRVQVIPARSSAGGLHVEFLQAIPVYESEVAFKAKHRTEALLQRWEAAHVAFWNPQRAPQPGLAEVSN